MRILVIGHGGPLSSAHACVRVFGELGCEARLFDNRRPSLLSLGRPWGALPRPWQFAYDRVRSRQLVRETAQFRPDVLFTQKADNLHWRALRDARATVGARFVLWYGDNPFHADVTSMSVLRSLAACDLCYTWGRFLIEPLKAAGCRRVDYLPFAFDPGTHPPEAEPDADERRRYGADVCFAGTWDPEREAALAAFVAFNLAVYGQRWPEHVSSRSPLAPHVRSGTVWGRDLVKRFKCATVVLNLLRGFNHTSHNFRTMEAAGIGGGVLLTPWTPEQAELFRVGEEIATFRSPGEAVAAVRDFVAYPERARAMADRAQRRVMAEHLLRHRLQRILDDVRAAAWGRPAAANPEGA